MEFAKSSAVIERSSDFAEKSFSIGDPVVIMKIMRSKLYSNPVKVLIQEYLCNARDANRESGSTKAIEVSGPSVFSKTFEVRDYGIGISPERMENVFIRYGESTKRKDNTQTGGFGIGAKSGWSYSDSFSVTTVTQEGSVRVKRFYSAIIDETEKGSLMKIADDEVTEEDTGTRIIVPVKEKDIRIFNDYIRQTVFFWREEVEVNGETGKIKFDFDSVTYKSKEWMLLSKNDNHLIGEFANVGSKCVAVVDGIMYDINYTAISDCNELNGKKDLLNDIFHNKFILFFKTGEINISANREELYYDEKTKLAVVNKLKVVESELINVVEKELNSETNYFKMVCKWNEFIGHNFTFKNGNSNFLSGFKWHGKPINVVPRIESSKILSIRKYFKNYNGRRMSTDVNDVFISKNVIIYENDEGNYLPNRLRIQTLINKHGSGETFFVIGYGDEVLTPDIERRKPGSLDYYTPAEFKKDKDKDRENFNLDMFGFPKMSKIEKFKKPRATSSGAVAAGPKQIMYRTKKVRFPSNNSIWNYIEIDPYQVDLHKEEGYYIPTSDGCAHFDDTMIISMDNTRGMRMVFNYIGSKNNIFFIPQKTLDRVKNHKLGFKMKPISEKISEIFSKEKEKIETMLQWKMLDDSRILDRFRSQLHSHGINSKNYKDINDPDLHRIFEMIETIGTSKLDNTNLLEFTNNVRKVRVESLNTQFPDFDNVKDFVDRMTKKYKLFIAQRVDYGTTVTQELIEYMNMVYDYEQIKLAK